MIAKGFWQAEKTRKVDRLASRVEELVALSDAVDAVLESGEPDEVREAKLVALNAPDDLHARLDQARDDLRSERARDYDDERADHERERDR